MYLLLFLLALASWRVAHLITDDEFPFRPVRDWAERKFPNYGWGLSCTFCISIWVGWAGAAVGFWLLDLPADVSILLACGGLATAIVLIEGLVGVLMGDD